MIESRQPLKISSEVEISKQPNPAQFDLLESFVGSEGIYFETIKESKELNWGTTVLYLERAISESCQDFLKSLDKIYNPLLKSYLPHKDLLLSFKFINDICFNNEVKYSIYGNRKILDHFFKRLGDIHPEGFNKITKHYIQDYIDLLKKEHAKEIDYQIKERIKKEKSLEAHTDWRIIFDLPLDQHAPLITQPIRVNLPGDTIFYIPGSRVSATLPDGNIIVGSPLSSDMLKIINPNTAKLVRRISQQNDAVDAIAVLPNDMIVVGAAQLFGRLRVIDPLSGALILSISQLGDAVNAICVLPDGNIAVGGTHRFTDIRVFNPNTGELINRFSQFDTSVSAISVLPNGMLALGGKNYYDKIRIINMDTGKLVDRFDQNAAITTTEELMSIIKENKPELVITSAVNSIS